MKRTSIEVKKSLLEKWIGQYGREPAEELGEAIYDYLNYWGSSHNDLLEDLRHMYRNGHVGVAQKTLDELIAEIAEQWSDLFEEAKTVHGLLDELGLVVRLAPCQ